MTLEPPSLTIRPGRTGGMGDARAYPAPLKAHPLSGCAKEPFQGGKPPRDGVLALAFRTLLSFQGTSPGALRRLTCGSRVVSPPERRDGTTGLSRSSKTSHLPGQRTPWGAPPATATPSHRSAVLRPPPSRASGRPPKPSDGSWWRSATSCLPMPTPLASSGEVLGPEELPCLQP